MNFNFGPIARTDAGGKKDTFNLASLPLHVMLNALVGSTSVEEFIAWLWHDLYKPSFHWVHTGKDRDGNDKFSNYHIPGMGAFDAAEATFANNTNVRIGLVSSHQPRKKKGKPIPRKDPQSGASLPMFQILEEHFLSDQGDQVNLGATVNYIQLSILSEPAMPTALVRSVIADSFIEVATKSVAKALRQAFTDDGRTPIEQVKFEFHTLFPHGLSASPDPAEIWNKLGKKFDVQAGKNFLMQHFTPVTNQEHEDVYKAEFTADLTGEPLLPEQMLKNIFSLAELLTLYQDSRTIVIAVPQSQLYTIDIATIEEATIEATRRRLGELNVLTIDEGIDYLSAAFESQVDIREVPDRRQKRCGKNFSRPLTDIILYPSQLLSRKRESPNCKICRITGTPFVTTLDPPPARFDKLFSGSFVDTEFIGTGQHIAPLTYLYVLNSPNAGGAGRKGVPKRTSMRGAFALFAPATQVAIVDQTSTAVERPPLDIGGRFQNSLNRITVTTQEFTLFQQMSRRIVAELWRRVGPNEPLGLPYLGAVLVTHEDRKRIQELLPNLDLLLSDIFLDAYPFRLAVQPAIEITMEAAISDSKHASKHTLLKISPHIISAGSGASIPVLIDDETRIDVTMKLFEHVAYLTEVTNNLKLRKRKLNQRDLWLKSISTGTDPVTSVLDSGSATVDTRRLNRDISVDSIAFNEAEKFWDRQIGTEDFAEDWEQYEKLKHDTSLAIEEYPILSEFIQTFQKEEGGSNESTK